MKSHCCVAFLIRVAAALIVAFVSAISGFSPVARSFDSARAHSSQIHVEESQRCPTRCFGVAKDVGGLVRDVWAYTRAYLPLSADELIDLVPPDYDSIKDSLQSSDKVRVFRKRNALLRTMFIGFEPTTNPKGIGLVLYPGALVKAEAYAPICRFLADMGYHAALCTPPLQTSLVDIDLADEVIRYWGDSVKLWTVAGHSMGGVVAAAWANQRANEYKDKLKGVVLLASYPSALPGITEGDLSDDSYITTSIYGSLDGLTTEAFIELSKAFLHPKTKFVCIEGGNHSQFYYGKRLQIGDNPATISREEQQEITRQSILQVLEQIEETANVA